MPIYLILAAGLVALVVGADWLVKGASSIATRLKIPSYVIGLTLVACGTSLPEFTVNMISASKGYTDIAFGNIVGSNIFNILWIMSFTAILKPIPVSAAGLNDLYIDIAATIMLFGVIYVGKKYHIERWQGALMLGTYTGYVAYLLK